MLMKLGWWNKDLAGLCQADGVPRAHGHVHDPGSNRMNAGRDQGSLNLKIDYDAHLELRHNKSLSKD